MGALVVPSTVAANSAFTVTASGGPAAPLDWVGLYLQSAPDQGNYLQYQFLNGTQTPPVNGMEGATLQFTAPSLNGLYTVRWFTGGGYTPVAVSDPITVTGGSGGVVRPPLTRHLVVNGDSNVAAYSVSAAEAWPTLLATALDIPHDNIAVGGKYSDGVLADVPLMLSYGASVCVVQIGTNDMAAAVQLGIADATARAAYLTKMRSIVTQLKPGCGQVVLVTPAYSLVAKEASRWAGWIDGLHALASEEDVALLDVYNYMRALAAFQNPVQFESYYVIPTVDAYHLSAAGHALVANFVLRHTRW